MTDTTPDLAGDVRRGLAWSTVSNLILRVSSLAVGIVLARLLTPEQFGVFAVALTVQSILMTIADLGLSADLIRSENPMEKAKTVGTLSLVIGALLAIGMASTSGLVAGALGSPAAADTIAVLAITLFLGGAGVVPYALLMRGMQQKKLFVIAVIDFLISTALTIGLVLAGFGVMSLAIGRVASQSVSLVLQFVLSGQKPSYGWNRDLVRPVLAFGLPVAAANLLSWGLLNVDNIVISRVAGATALGFYVLAFNVSNWPMSAIGQIIRSISLPLFSRSRGEDEVPVFSRMVGLAWTAALPAGAFLAILSAPLIAVVYGDTWALSAPVLAGLGLFGAVRVMFDIFASYLLARGASRAVLWTQIVWCAALVPAVIVGTTAAGIVGAAWVHLAVALLFVVPGYAIALRRHGVTVGALLRHCLVPTLAIIPSGAAAFLLSNAFDEALWSLLVGGGIGAALYAVCVIHWVRATVKASNQIKESVA